MRMQPSHSVLICILLVSTSYPTRATQLNALGEDSLGSLRAAHASDMADGNTGLKLAALQHAAGDSAESETLLHVMRFAASDEHKDAALTLLKERLTRTSTPTATSNAKDGLQAPAVKPLPRYNSLLIEDFVEATGPSPLIPESSVTGHFHTQFLNIKFNSRAVPVLERWNSAIKRAAVDSEARKYVQTLASFGLQSSQSEAVSQSQPELDITLERGSACKDTSRVENVFSALEISEARELEALLLRGLQDALAKTLATCSTAYGAKVLMKVVGSTLYMDEYLGWHRPFQQSSSTSQLTAIYAVAAGYEHILSNQVTFSDPRLAAQMQKSPNWFSIGQQSVWPMVPGEVTVFPSYVQHHIRPNLNQDPRIYIKLDLQVFSPSQTGGSDTLVNPNTCLASVPSPLLRNTVGLWWPTPVLRHRFAGSDVAELNAKLAAEIMQMEQTEPNVSASNKGGWHSEYDLFERSNPLLQKLRGLMYDAIFRYIASAPKDARETEPRTGDMLVDLHQAWVCVNRKGHFNAPHIHLDATVSGVYYVKAGKTNANLFLMDPRQGAQAYGETPSSASEQVQYVSSTPRDGLVVLFPSWLQHFVDPHDTDEPRIAIAFNAKVKSSSRGEGLAFWKPKEHV